MNTMKTVLLMALLTGLMLLVGKWFGGAKGMLVMLIMSLAMNIGSYWFSDKIVLNMYGARPAEGSEAPHLIGMVEKLARQANMPMPKVYIIDDNGPNAFATGRDPEHGVVAVTTGILRLLTAEELEGVIAHELSHIRNRDTLISTIVAAVAGVITYMAQMAMMFGGSRSDDEESSGSFIGDIAMMLLAPLAAMLIQMGISRSREYLADQTGGEICGQPKALASALQKIEHYAMHGYAPNASPATAHMFIINPLSGSGQWLRGLFSTHPATQERVTRLLEQARKRGQ